MNLDVLFSSKTDQWSTPQWLFDELNEEFGFSIGVCADETNHKCESYFTKEQDGLSQKWDGVCWCNPPYGREVGKWVRKAFESSRGEGATVVMLMPARTDTKWFHDYIYKNPSVEIRFLRGRLKFGDGKNSAPFPSMLVIFNSKHT